MARIYRTQQAQRDLAAILDKLENQNSRAADNFSLKFEQLCYIHANYPALGADSREFADLLLCFTVRRYAIFYRVVADGIVLTRIILGARPIPRFFE